jgi:preprotein translocase subunit YajC
LNPSSLFSTLAQVEQPTQTTTAQPGSPTSSSPTTQTGGFSDLLKSPLTFFMLALLVLYFMMTKSSKKQKQERENLLGNLKRGDRIQTIGGMIGTVVDVDKNEVLLKIDETTNTKARFLRSAIHSVIVDKKSDQAK